MPEETAPPGGDSTKELVRIVIEDTTSSDGPAIDAEPEEHPNVRFHRRQRPGRRKALEALQYLQSYLMDGNESDDVVRERVNAILVENANRLRALAHGMARARAEENVIIGQDFDRCMDLLSAKITDDSSISDIVSVANLLNNRDKTNMQLILEVSKVPDPSKLDKPGDKIMEKLEATGIIDIPTASERKKAVSVLDKIIREAAKRNMKGKVDGPKPS